MAANLTNLDTVLKEFYLPTVRRQINDSSILLKRLKRDTESVVGRKYIMALSYGRNEGIGARADGGTLPTAGNQSYSNIELQMAYNYGRIKVTGPTIAATRKDVGAFVRAVDSEIKGTTRDLKKDVNRQLHGDGTGVIATCGTTSASTTVQLATDAKMSYFRAGMKVDIVTKSTGVAITNGSNREISSVDATNRTITLTGADNVTTSDSHGVTRTGSWSNEMEGLVSWLAQTTNTIGGINRNTAGNAYFRPNVLSNSGTLRALSLDLMQQAEDEAEIAASGEISLLVTDHTQRRKYYALVRADRRHVNTMKLDGGFDAVEFNGKPMVVDPDCLPNRIYFIDESTFAIGMMSDYDWMDKDGAILSRVSGEDAYEAVMYCYKQLGCDTPAQNTTLSDLSA